LSVTYLYRTMGRLFLLLLLAFHTTVSGAQTADNEDASFLLNALETIQSFGPRPEGSLGESQTFDYLAGLLETWNLDYERRDFFDLSRGHSFSSTISLSIPGAQPDTLIVAAPINTGILDSDGAVGIALALTVARYYRRTEPGLSLRILFLGAEKGEEDYYPLGSGRFLEEFYQEHPTALIYLDMAHIPNRLSILTDSGANIAPIWLVESTLSRLDEMNLGFLVQGNRPQLFRFNIPGRENILKGYFDANIPALAYQSAEGPLPSSEHKEWASQFLGYLKGTIDGNPSGLPEFWDHHYLFFQIQNQYIILNQGTYILLLLALFALVMILAVSFPKNLTNAGLIIWKHLWQLPVGLIFIFLFLLGATLMLEGIFLLREFSDLWEYAPITFFSFKILITLFLFFTTFYLVKRMPLNRWAVFYAYSSILVMGLGFLIALLLGLSLSFYFLWSLLLASAANLLPQRWLKLLAILGAPFWLIKGLIDIFSAQELVLIQNILLDPLAGNFILAFLIFPFLLLFSSFHFIRHQKPERNDRFRAILISLADRAGDIRHRPLPSLFCPLWRGAETTYSYPGHLEKRVPLYRTYRRFYHRGPRTYPRGYFSCSHVKHQSKGRQHKLQHLGRLQEMVPHPSSRKSSGNLGKKLLGFPQPKDLEPQSSVHGSFGTVEDHPD
jgi:hypothetical protein